MRTITEFGNIDATIICQRPKLAPYREQMIKNVAKALNIGYIKGLYQSNNRRRTWIYRRRTWYISSQAILLEN